MSLSDLFGTLTAQLRSGGLEVTPVELAEMLWLARHLPAPPAVEKLVTPPPPVVGRSTTPSDSGTTGQEPTDATPKTPEEQTPPKPPPKGGDAPSRVFTTHSSDLSLGRRGAIVRAPSAPALPNALALSRALRPLLKKRVSSRIWELDEDSTVDATAAQSGILTPVFRPGAERWFDLALVVDLHETMHVWTQAVVELRRLLVRHGGFRNVRQYGLRVRDGKAEVLLESKHVAPASLISDPSGRRLTVIVTDAVSPDWTGQPLRAAIAKWARHSPVVMVHVLPRRMWPHTAVGFADRPMSPFRAGAPNAEWQVERTWWESPRHDAVPVPVVTLDASQLAGWAKALMQVSAAVSTGIMLDAADTAPKRGAKPKAAQPRPAADITPAQRVQRFRAAASALAYELACYFAATQVTLPILRILQRKLAPSTGPGHLAEFLLSGLIYPQAVSKDPERTLYEFHDGVRELLRDQLRADEVMKVTSAIEDFLKANYGLSYDLTLAFEDLEGTVSIPEEAQPLLTPTRELLDRFGIKPQSKLESAMVRFRDLSADQRARLAPVAVLNPNTEGKQKYIPAELWGALLDQTDVAPFVKTGVVAIDTDGRVRVHPELRAAMLPYFAADDIRAAHRRVVEYYGRRPRALIGLSRRAIDDDGYYYKFFLTHVSAIGDDKIAEEVLLDPEWIARRIQAAPSSDFVEDLARFPHVPAIRDLQDATKHRGLQWEDPLEWAESLLRDTEYPDPDADPAPSTAQQTTSSGDTSRQWALIAGTGYRPVTALEKDAATTAARLVGELGYGLIAGSWRGVDDLAFAAFQAARQAAGASLEGALVEFMSENGSRRSTEGEAIPFGPEAEGSLSRAPIVVLVGGNGHTFRTGTEAAARLLPVIPLGMTGGDAAKMFGELVEVGEFLPDDPLGLVQKTTDTLDSATAARLRELLQTMVQPDTRVRTLCRAYAESPAVNHEKCEERILQLLRKWPLAVVAPPRDSDTVVDKLLRAFSCRVSPNPDVVAELTEFDQSSKVELQRLKTLEVAFETRALRSMLPQDLAQRTYRQRHDDPIDRQLVDLWTNRISALARVLAATRSLGPDQSPSLDDLRSPAVTEAMALDWLRDPDPGWRLAGLAHFEASEGEPPVQAIVGAVGFEETYRVHLSTALSALRKVSVSGSAEDRAAVLALARRFPNDPDAHRIIERLSASATTPSTGAHDPKKTWALVVGADQYLFGADWTLAGAAADGVRFANWLLERGVPANQIRVCLSVSSLDALGPGLNAALSAVNAQRATVTEILEKEVRNWSGDTLIVFWAGQGSVSPDTDFDRLLYFSDSTKENPAALSLLDLCGILSQQQEGTFATQAFFIDTSATHANWIIRDFVPKVAVPTGLSRQAVTQFKLVGAKRGEVAAYDQAARTGLFSRELLKALQVTATDAWPPDFSAVAATVSRAMAQLGKVGKSVQTPTFEVNQVAGVSTPAAPAPAPPERWQDLVTAYNDLRETAPSMERTQAMEAIVTRMESVRPPMSSPDILERVTGADRGWRLAAYTAARIAPSKEFMERLCQSLLKYQAMPTSRVRGSALGDNRPFGEFHGLRALERVDAVSDKLDLKQARLLNQVINALSRHTDQDRRRVIDVIRAHHAGPEARRPKSTFQNGPAGRLARGSAGSKPGGQRRLETRSKKGARKGAGKKKTSLKKK